MHPIDFFKNVKVIDRNIKCVQADGSIIEKLKLIHPRNFISTDITFYIAELEVSYDTRKGNRKTTKKYAIQQLDMTNSTELNLQAKIQTEANINKYNVIHKSSALKNFSVDNAKIMCLAVLRIE